LPNSQLQILAAIENELQADPSLGSAFSAFTSVTRSAAMPAAEQLRTPNWVAGWRGSRRMRRTAFLGRMIVPVVAIVAAVVIALTAALAAWPESGRDSCEPAGAAARYAATCVPPGRGGHLGLPGFRPPMGHA
jgi:hypothetical protein